MGSGFALDMYRRFRENASSLRSQRRGFENKDKLDKYREHEHHDIKQKLISTKRLDAVKAKIKNQALHDRKIQHRKVVRSIILAGILLLVILFTLQFFYRNIQW